MKILVVSNYYPPHFIGGYELGCHEVMQALKARGHRIQVLTSTYGVAGPQDDGEVFRRLTLTHALPDVDSFSKQGRHLARVEIQNQREFARRVRAFRPDVVYFWSMVGLSLSLVYAAARRRLPFAVFVSDPWLSQWRTDRWYDLLRWRPRPIPSRLLWRAIQGALTWGGLILPPCDKPFAMRHVQFCSQYLKDAALREGLPVAEAAVIHWGTAVPLAVLPDGSAPAAPRRLLYVGQIMPHKGVHTAVEALARLRALGHGNVTLTVAGGSVRPDYEESLRRLVADHSLEDAVRFTGGLPRAEVLALYADHDILVFPSAWEEPFAITPLEAMASGLVVVGTTTGGSPEIFEEGVNALTFPKEDASACAAQIARLLDAPVLYDTIRRQGQKTIGDRFRFPLMVDHIEAALMKTLVAI